MASKPPRVLRVPVLLVVGSMAQACGNESTGPGGGGNLQQVNEFLVGVSDWPTQPDSMSPTVSGTPSVTEPVVDSVPVYDSLGVNTPMFDVEYVCTTTPYSFRQTPEKLVMLSPDRDLLWAGALLQGQSHATGGGPGSLLALPIAERAPIQVSIPSLPTGSNFRNVDVVTQANVEGAIGDIIGNAVAQGLFSPASDDFQVDTYNSESEFALKTKLSGRYLGFSGSASGSVSTSTSETTVAVRYVQKLYEVVVALPATPRGFFTDAFTEARLNEQVALGRIAADNQPIYVANIVYGRMMMFTMTANASATELTAIVNASYDATVGNVTASLSARHQSIASSSRIAISTYGGGRTGTAAMIRTGDWRQYFNHDNVELSDALPLSYTFRTLTGETAAVSEITNYSVQSCQPLEDTPLQYINGGAAQSVAAPVSTPFESHLGDVTGDGIEDLILNHRSPTANQVAVLPGAATGTFGAAVVTAGPAAPADGWGAYQLLIGDVNDDGRADLVWNNTGPLIVTNRTFVALGQANGAVSFGTAQVHPSSNWAAGWRPFLADLDGDGDKDLVWNFLATINSTWRGTSNGDGTFDMSPANTTQTPQGWASYEMYVANVDFDAAEELVWNSRNVDATNRTWVGQLTTGSIALSALFDHPQSGPGWTQYGRVVGDFDGDQRSDLAFVRAGRYVHMKYGVGFGLWQTIPFVDLNAAANGSVPQSAAWMPSGGDFNGDGVDDLILNRLDASNWVYVVPGKPSRGFAPALPQPNHPASATWTSVQRMLVGDVSGEGRDDVVWVVPGVTTQVYVGLGRE